MTLAPYRVTIRDNAIRLCADARLMLLNDRYASSVALSILAIEEIGKYVMLDEDRRGNNPSDHAAKQKAVAEQYQGDLWLSLASDIDDDLMSRRMEELRRLGPIEKVLSGPKLVTETSAKIDLAFRAAIKRNVTTLIEARYYEGAESGAANSIKKNAIYVDVRPDGSVKNDPARFTLAEAEEWLTQANRALIVIGYDE